MVSISEKSLQIGSWTVIIVCCVLLLTHSYKSVEIETTTNTPSRSTVTSPSSVDTAIPSSNSLNTSTSSESYTRTSPGYDPKAPLMPRSKDDIEPLYNEVQRLKEQNGMTDKEAVNKILRDAGEIP